MNRPNRLFALAASAACATLLPAQPASDPAANSAPPTETLLLDEIVVSATRTERRADDTPGSITAVDLRGLAGATLADLVRSETLLSVPFTFSGAGVAYGRGGTNSVNLRGIEGNRVLLQVDGVRVPDEFRLGGSEPIGRDYFDPELYRRLEIFQGSASALYGGDALGGVVTFTTKSPEDFGLGVDRPWAAQVKAGARTLDDGWHAALNAAVAAGPLSALVVWSRREGGASANNGAVAPNAEDHAADALLGKLVWRPAPAHRLEAAVEYFQRDTFAASDNREGTITIGGVITENTVASDTGRFRLSAAWRFAPGAGRLAWVDELEARAYLQDSVARDLAVERVAFNPPSATHGTFRDRLITTAFHNDTAGFSLTASKRLHPAHRLAYGVEGSRTATSKPWTAVVTNSRGTTFPDAPRMAETDTTRLGAYLQHEADWTLAGGRRFSVIPGLRLDRFKLTPDNSPAYLTATAGAAAPSFDEVALTPKLGLVFGLAPRLNAYAQYNRGFRYPSAEDLTATFTNALSRYRTLPNPNLREETSDAFEAGLKGQPFPALSVRAAVFYTTYDDFIEQIAFAPPQFQDFVNWRAGTFMTQNRADARIDGGELWARLALGGLDDALAGWTLTASLGHARGTFASAGGARQRLTSVEPLKSTATLAYDAPRGRWGASLFVESAQGGRPGGATQFYAPGYTVLDLSVSWRPRDRLTLSLGLHNLTDEKYWRYGSVRGVSATNLNEQERRTQPGFHAAFAATLRL